MGCDAEYGASGEEHYKEKKKMFPPLESMEKFGNIYSSAIVRVFCGYTLAKQRFHRHVIINT